MNSKNNYILNNKKIISSRLLVLSRRSVFFVIVMVVGLFAQDFDYINSAKTQMQVGKYSEAIDLLNNHISLNPRTPESYALRAECFEHTGQQYKAVLDWEKAVSVEPLNPELNEKLILSRNKLNIELNEKIKGHERELAIDPESAENYLAIGKSYMQKESYKKAEEYYDEYMKRVSETSPDEILRYTEILAKNDEIKKGERILKEYADKYPEDWRLQSRYGYFLMWNGKYSSAKKRFNDALIIKPFFKEAQDGWDVVSRKPYVTQNNPIPRVKEYTIDKYYRLLRTDAENSELRLKLAKELEKENRIEETYNQYRILTFLFPENQYYQKLLDDFYVFRDSVYHKRIDSLNNLLQTNPTNKKNIYKIAEYYMFLEEYDNSVKTIEAYIQDAPNEKDSELLFLYAKGLAWNNDLNRSFELLDELIQRNPNYWEYKMFRAQLSIWEERDIVVAKSYVDEVLIIKPNNVDALIAKATLLGISKEFDSAYAYLDRVRAIDPMNFDVLALQSKLEFQELRAEEDIRFQILETGRRLLVNGECDSALIYYKTYLSQARPNNAVKKEYGDVLFCSEKYDEALQIFNEVLADGYMYEAELERGKVFYVVGDSIKALDAFGQLVEKEPYEFVPRLYLGDSYMKVEEYDSARAVYDILLTWDLDSVETSLIEKRIAWIPPTGLNAVLSSFPYLLGFAPAVQYYSDNLSFQFSKVGTRLDVGIFQHLMLGVSLYEVFTRANYESLNPYTLGVVDSLSLYGFTGKREFTTFKGHAFIPFSKTLFLSGAYGILRTSDYDNQHETEMALKYDNQNSFGISASFLNSDAEMIVFSPYLIDYHDSNGVRLRASLYRLQGYYTHNNKLLISGYFDYIDISDSNKGNTFQIRFGSKFTQSFSAGYEYFFQNYKYNDVLIYYSPRNYDSHCLWGEFQIEDNDDSQLFLGGKIGYAPSVNQLILEAHFIANYRITSNFNLVGNIGFGQSSQYNSAYRYLSLNVHAYWTL